MKKKKRRLLSILLSLAMMLGMLSGMSLTAAAQATSINITFKSSGSSSDGTSARDSIDYIIESGAAYVSSLSASKVFNGKDGCGIKLGSTSQAGSLTLNLSNPMTVSAITVEVKRYSVSDSCGLKIQDKTYDDVGSDFETFTYTYAQPTEISSVALSSTGKRIYIKSVTLIGQAASDHTHNFTYSASGATITATCGAGCPDGYDTNGIALTITAPSSLECDGSAKEATLSGYPNPAPDGLAAEPSISYNPGGNSAPTTAGNYTASFTWGEKTGSVDFTLTALEPVSYMKWDGIELIEMTGDDACKNYTVVTDSTTFEDGKWYVAKGTGVNCANIDASQKTIYLILLDDCSLSTSEINISKGGALTIYTGSTGETIKGNGALTVNAQYNAVNAQQSGALTVDGGAVTLTSQYTAFNDDGIMAVRGGSVTACATGDGQSAISSSTNVSVSNGMSVKAGASETDATYVTDLSKWGKTEKWVRIEKPSHTHSFTYSADGATIKATCGTGCDITTAPTITVTPPTLTREGGSGSAEATLTKNTTWTADIGLEADPEISYFSTTTADSTTGGTALAAAPTTAGNYYAQITIENATAAVAYTIAEPLKPVSYLAWDDGQFVEQTIDNYTPLTSSEGSVNAKGWVVVEGNVDIQYIIPVDSLNLILCDDATLTLKGISATHYGDLTIYAQSTGENMGTLTINSSSTAFFVGGDITINGGNINATGYDVINNQYGGVTVNGGNLEFIADDIGIGTKWYDIIINGGTVKTTGSVFCGIIANSGGRVVINGGTIEATGDYAIVGTASTTIANANVIANGVKNGIWEYVGDLTINSGTITAKGDFGISAKGTVTINGGEVETIGETSALSGTVKNAINGTGWTNTAGTMGETEIATNTEGQDLSGYKKAQFPAAEPIAKCVYSVYEGDDWVEKSEDFANLEGAMNRAKEVDGDVVLLGDVTRDTPLVVPEDTNIKLDLDGKTLTFTCVNAIQAGADTYFTVENGTVVSDSDDIFVASDGASIFLGAEGKLTVNGTGSVIKANADSFVSIDKAEISTTAIDGAVATASGENADITMRQCAMKSAGAKMFATDNDGSVSIMGGIFSHDPSGEGITLMCNSEGAMAVEGGVIAATTDTTYKFAAIQDPVVTVTKTTEKTYDGDGVELSASVEPETVSVNGTYDTEKEETIYDKEVTIAYTYKWSKKNADSDTYTDISGATSDTYTTGANVTDSGTFRCVVTSNGNNYTGNATVTITKAEPTAEVTPVTDLVYDGKVKKLVTAEVEGGTLQYRIGKDGKWEESIPEATDFDTYTVYYYIKGDGNHKDNGSKTEPMGSADVTIKCLYSNEWVDGKWYNKNGTQTYKPQGDWKKDGEDWMYVTSSGWYPKNRWQKIDFKWYFFDREGHMLKDAYQKGADGKIWYIGKNGAWDGKAAVKGWKQDSKGWWFGLYGKEYLKSTWKMINGNWYYFKSDGYIAMNEFVQGWWLNKSGAWKDPIQCSWHKSGSKWWYGTKDGWYAKGRSYTIDGEKYTFDKKGYTK